MNTRKALLHGSQWLSSENPRLEAEILLMKVLHQDKAQLYSSLEKTITEKDLLQYENYLHERHEGRPLSYIVGERPFFNLSLFVDERVLIPRPETELLVELSIAFLTKRNKSSCVLDLCTGSGAIAVAIGWLDQKADIDASDISPGALQVAKKNRNTYHLQTQIHLIQSDGFSSLPNKYHLIVSNPPYIPTAFLQQLPSDVQKEPLLALDGGEDGCAFIKPMIQASKKHLRKKGLLLFEIGGDISLECLHWMKTFGFNRCFIQKDLAGIDRICGGYND